MPGTVFGLPELVFGLPEPIFGTPELIFGLPEPIFNLFRELSTINKVSITNLKFNIMTTNQKIRLRMYLGTRNFVSQNQTTANAIPKFAASYAALLCTIDESQSIGEMQGINKTGLAMDKNKLKKKLIALAVKYSNKVAILAKLNQNDTLLKEVRFNESDLLRLSEVT
jgi:hypothetical protein